MSEQNILNPTPTSLFNFDFGYSEGLPELRSTFQARSGNIFSRQQFGLGRIYDLLWLGRDLTTKLAFQNWENQYRNDFFSLGDWEMARYFTGRFDGPLTYSPRGNNAYDIRGRFVELPGLPMFSLPTNFARDSVFIDERNGKGEDLVKLTGTWTIDVNAAHHGGAAYVSATTNDIAEWQYFGYRCDIWAIKWPAGGIFEWTVTRVRDGAIVLGPANVDTFNAGATLNSASLAGILLPLDLYRVKVRVTGTKNAGSTNFWVYADAIQVLR